MDGDENIMLFQDHATPRAKLAMMQALAAERRWRMDLGPAGEETDRVAAGVGVVWNPGRVRVHAHKLHANEGRYFERIGLLKKYTVQFVHGAPVAVYNVYAWTSGSRD
ncbi:MAG: hypothetical protein ACKPKO_10740, partial [Candidatus Fonsibacter sp.]